MRRHYPRHHHNRSTDIHRITVYLNADDPGAGIDAVTNISGRPIPDVNAALVAARAAIDAELGELDPSGDLRRLRDAFTDALAADLVSLGEPRPCLEAAKVLDAARHRGERQP